MESGIWNLVLQKLQFTRKLKIWIWFFFPPWNLESGISNIFFHFHFGFCHRMESGIRNRTHWIFYFILEFGIALESGIRNLEFFFQIFFLEFDIALESGIRNLENLRIYFFWPFSSPWNLEFGISFFETPIYSELENLNHDFWNLK